MAEKSLNAKDYDGLTPETSFDWNSPPEGVTKAQADALLAKNSKLLDQLSHVRKNAKQLLSAYDSSGIVVETIIANGWDKKEGLPPFPLPGTLAPLDLATLAPGLIVSMKLREFLNTPIETPAGSVTPITLLRQISE